MSVLIKVSDLYASLQNKSPLPVDIPPIVEEYNMSGYYDFFKRNTPAMVQDKSNENYAALNTARLPDGTPLLTFVTRTGHSFIEHSIAGVSNATLDEFQPIVGPILLDRSPFVHHVISNILLRGLAGSITKNVELFAEEYHGGGPLTYSLGLLFKAFLQKHLQINGKNTDLFESDNSCKLDLSNLAKYTYSGTKVPTNRNSRGSVMLFYFNPVTAAFGLPLNDVRAFAVSAEPVVIINQEEDEEVQITFSSVFRVELFFPGGMRLRVSTTDSKCTTKLVALI